MSLVRFLESRAALDRRLESIPGDQVILNRIRSGAGLTRPELAVLLSFAKLELTEDVVASRIPEIPLTHRYIERYFPAAIRQSFAPGVEKHRLRREIISMSLANAVLNRGGAAFVVGLTASTGRSAVEVASAYLVAEALMDADLIFSAIDTLDHAMPNDMQMRLYLSVQSSLTKLARAVLLRGISAEMTEPVIAVQKANIEQFHATPVVERPASLMQLIAEVARDLESIGTPATLAQRIAELKFIENIVAIGKLAATAKCEIAAASSAYFDAAARLEISTIELKASQIQSADEYDRKVIEQALAVLDEARDAYARRGLAHQSGVSSLATEVNSALKEAAASINAATVLTPSRLLVHAMHVRDTVARIAVPA